MFFKISNTKIKNFKKKHGALTWQHLLAAINQPYTPGQNNISLSLCKYLHMQLAMHRMNAGMPLPLATGKTIFMGHHFYMQRGVFQPRVETEELFSKAMEKWFRQKFSKKTSSPQQHSQKQFTDTAHSNAHPILLDACCGSGILGISALLHNPCLNIIAIDINPKAIRLSRKNAKQLLPTNSQKNYLTLQGDILSDNIAEKIKKIAHNLPTSPITKNNKKVLSYIMCNPPYIPSATVLSQEVLQYDPHKALFAGKDGLIFYRHMRTLANKLLLPDGKIVLELDDSTAFKVANIFNNLKIVATHKTMPLKKNNFLEKKTTHPSKKLFTMEIVNDMFGKKRIGFITKVS